MSTTVTHARVAQSDAPRKDPAGNTIETNLYELGLLGKGFQKPTRLGARMRPAFSKSDNRPSSKSGPTGHRSAKAMVGSLDLQGGRSRRDFIGAECAVCEEPLEHMLQGERVLQLTCSHVAHEQCFYEYYTEQESQYCPTCQAPLSLDSARGGNVLDLAKLSKMSRRYNEPSAPPPRPSEPTYPRDVPIERPVSPVSRVPTQQSDYYQRGEPSVVSAVSRSESRRHRRNDSGGGTSSVYPENGEPEARKHDYDVQSMETSLSPRAPVKNPIPPPIISVRSEFPTLNRSRQQQSITCLVTVEVQEGKWKPEPEPESEVPPIPVRNPAHHAPAREPFYQSPQALESIAKDLFGRVENWHGLDTKRFGKLRLHGQLRVGKDRVAWQDLECFLFTEMLICIKEKKYAASSTSSQWGNPAEPGIKPRCTLKGSILIKKHLKDVKFQPDEMILTLLLSVAELPTFHLQIQDRNQLEVWRHAFQDLESINPPSMPIFEAEMSADEEEIKSPRSRRFSGGNSSFGAGKSYNTAPTEYTEAPESRLSVSVHVPLDIVVVIPVSSSMQGVKITQVRDALRFLVSNLGYKDRMGLVTFGSSGGGVPIVGMTSKTWSGWSKVLDSIRPVGQKSLRSDVVEGANVAMDLLMQRKSNNPISSILLISDSSTSDPESVDFVVSRAEAAKVSIHSFGLGLTHKPDIMIELSTRTKASYTYVKDWMMLRESVAGCLGSLQTVSHQNVKLRLKLPEGSPAKFAKISGALHISRRATGRDAEASLGDLRFGDKRDVLVQLAIEPDNTAAEQPPQDAWETIVSGLESLGNTSDPEESRSLSVEEVALIQADLSYGDLLRDGAIHSLPRPSLLAITMLPAVSKAKGGRPQTPPIPAHPAIIQRRMELLTSDMLTRALTLVSKGQHERAQHLLTETRSILKGLGKGNLPPIPNTPNPSRAPPTPSLGPISPTPPPPETAPGFPPSTPLTAAPSTPLPPTPTAAPTDSKRTPSTQSDPAPPPSTGTGIDATTMSALDAELSASLEWINHPAIFGRDSRKAVLQAIGVISSQRGYTLRTPAETLWAERIGGVRRLLEKARMWREAGAGDEALVEE
ncbi:hypothetical protein K402DRAFT_419726 [Aulographum hederae CBS 113979]|uniref:von Willebrand and RING finger domain-containing protein n=1 Tax=Aulographum hederae CBS 113979 TaxID=1176131 RepID=A0A6G1H4A4_9PEZI|nr:hypothetical protein K402DRAFT_419726 [Aulographum hederae CBS 113979]